MAHSLPIMTLVMIGKEQDIILCTILQPGIYFQPLRYIVSTLNVNWQTVTVAGGTVTQDTVLTSVWAPNPINDPASS